MIIIKYVPVIWLLILVNACGGSSSVAEPPGTQVPVNISIENAALSAGVPTTFVYRVPAPAEPYTHVTIDLVKSLETANITLTPTP